MAAPSDPERLLELLHGERQQWEHFGVAPGDESVQLLIQGLVGEPIPELDCAFLFGFTAAAITRDMDSEDRPELEFALLELADSLLNDAHDSAMAPVLGVASAELIWAGALQEAPSKVLHVARVEAGVGPEPAIYALLVAEKGLNIEVVLKPGRYRVARTDNPEEALSSLASWVSGETV